MKNIIILFLLLVLTKSVSCQTTDPLYNSANKDDISIQYDTNYKYLKKVNNQIVFEKIYTLDSLRSNQIEEILISNMPNLSDVYEFQKSSNIITFTIKGVYIDFKKFGLKRMSMNGILAFPMNASISIVWKDGKYKLTASNISFNVVSFGIQKITQILLNNDGTLNEKRLVIQLGNCVEETLSEKFLINSNTANW
jgi:hypothetical protein